jgi:hypothetical protein
MPVILQSDSGQTKNEKGSKYEKVSDTIPYPFGLKYWRCLFYSRSLGSLLGNIYQALAVQAAFETFAGR